MAEQSQAPYRLLNWSILFSPLSNSTDLADAWEFLGLAGKFDTSMNEVYVRTFLVDMPQPKAPLLFSSLLRREASACREDWMRVASHLGMKRTGASLPPDHLALACELLAHAWTAGENVLLEEGLERYLIPWVECALELCEEPLRSTLLLPFKQDLEGLSLISA